MTPPERGLLNRAVRGLHTVGHKGYFAVCEVLICHDARKYLAAIALPDARTVINLANTLHLLGIGCVPDWPERTDEDGAVHRQHASALAEVAAILPGEPACRPTDDPFVWECADADCLRHGVARPRHWRSFGDTRADE